MQSANFPDLKETYNSNKTLTWKIRKAIVEGLSGRYEKGEIQRHFRLLHDLTTNPTERQYQLKALFDNPDNQRDRGYLDGTVRDFHPSYGNWKTLTHQDITHLADEGVIIQSDAETLGELLEDIINSPRRQVIRASVELPDLSTKKLSHPSQVRLLNGLKAAQLFAQSVRDKGQPFPEFNSLNNTSLDNLQIYGFTLPVALQFASQDMTTQAAFAIKRPDGNYTYIFPADMIAGLEAYYEVRKYRHGQFHSQNPNLVTPGSLVGEFKYNGELNWKVPSRFPKGRAYHTVVSRHLPHLDRGRDITLEWFNTELECQCEYARNFRNQERRRGRHQTGRPHIIDEHPWMVLYLLDDTRHTIRGPSYHTHRPNSMVPYPTEWAVALSDAISNRLHNTKGNTELLRNRLLIEAIKQYDPEKMFQDSPPQEQQVLKPLYSGIRQINLA